MRNKKYNPNTKYNPVVQARKIDKLNKQVENHGKTINSISISHDNHISYLGNFARHDIKNAMLSMDSIVSTTEPHEFSSEKIKSLTTYIEIVMETIDNFAKLIPYNSEGFFLIKDLMIAIELLTRSDMTKNDIVFSMNYNRNNMTKINQPFQPILQMINNLVINSINSLKHKEFKEICIESIVDNDYLMLTVKDNGEKIPDENLDKIFDFGFSTTGGSGIGLHHADYLCGIFNGTIKINQNLEDESFKQFEIKLPCKKQL